MKCPNCGKEITDDSLFCEYCGAKVTKEASPKKQKKWVPWVAGIVAFIVGFVVVATLLDDATNSNSTSTVEAISEATYVGSNFTVSPESITFTEYGEETIVSVYSDHYWYFNEASDTWIHTKKNNQEELAIWCDYNPGATRYGRVKLKNSDGESCLIYITQN